MSEELEWRRKRLGKITASQIRRIVNGTPKGWLSFMQQLRKEIEKPEDALAEKPISSDAIEHGKETEEQAKANIELDLGVELESPGFVVHPSIPYIGATSDFLVTYKGARWNGEIKCPVRAEHHFEVLMHRVVPAQYVPQVQCQMLVHNLDRTLFVSYYNPEPMEKSGYAELPDPSMRLAIVEVSADRSYQQMMVSRCERFWDDFQMFMRNGGIMPLTPSRTPQRF